MLCKTRAQKSMGTTTELISLCKEVKFGKEQIPNMILLYYSVFLPRLIYNAEAWSSLTEANIQCLLKAQLHYLRRVLEIPKSTPTAALFLDHGILPIQYEIEKKQLLSLKCVLEKNADDPVQQTYYQMLEYQGENNWANHITFLRRKYNLPLNDCNLLSMSKQEWKTFVTDRIKHHALNI